MAKDRKKPKKPKVPKIWRGLKIPKAPPSEKKMQRDYFDVLQNIEFVLLDYYREDADVDDRLCRDVLRAALAGRAPTSEPARWILEGLNDVRAQRDDVPDDVWAAGLTAILKSVRRHSTFLPGEQSYLAFVSQFMP